MLDRFTPVFTNQYQELSKKWNSLLTRGESVCLIFPYLSDRQHRIKQYTDLLEDNDLIPININLSLLLIDEIAELKNYIYENLPVGIKKNSLEESLNNLDKIIVLVVADGELMLKAENEQFLAMLQNIILEFKNIRVLSAFESNIHKSISDFNRYNLVFQNILYYPLYNDEDSMLFIDYLCKKWKMKMPQPTRKSITHNSGGFFWLIKEACRIFREEGNWSSESPSYQLRINSIIKSLSDDEKIIIDSCPHLKSFENSEYLKHLKKINLINDENSVSVSALLSLINENNKDKDIFQLNNGEITLKGISLSGILSNTEYELLKFFIKKPNTPISRDEIASILWPSDTENRYSDWAIDQAVKRLRDRLVSLRLSPRVIRSVRGVGYEFRT